MNVSLRLPPQRLSVRGRLVLLVLAGMVPMGMAALATIYGLYVEERQAFEEQLRGTTRALSQMVDQELTRRESLLRTLAVSPSLQSGDLASFYDYARQVAPDGSTVITLSDLTGQQILNTRRPYGTRELPRVSFDGLADNGDRAVVSDLYYAPLGKAYSFAVRVPVRVDGTVRHYLSMGGYAAHLQTVLESQKLPSNWFGSVVDRRGIIVARSRNSGSLVGRPISAQTRAALAANREGLHWATSREGHPVLASFVTSERYQWTFVIGVPESEVTGALTRAVRRFALAAILLMALATTLAWWLAWGIAKPVERIRRAAQRLGEGGQITNTPTGLVEVDVALAAMQQAAVTITASTDRMKQEVAKAVAEAERAREIVLHHQRMETLAGLTGGLAHDVNNLLMVIGSNATLLERSRTGPTSDRALSGIKRSVASGARLTRQLLTFARRQPLAPQLLDLAAVVPTMLDLARPALGRAIQLTTVSDFEAVHVLLDPSELELALLNLALNARDAMPEGGHLTVRLARDSTHPDQVRLSVTDTGIGIAAEHLPRIFEPFFTTKPMGKGTGLGLSQVFGMCREAGGTVEVTSALGVGTTLTLVLPLSREDLVPQSPPAGAVDTSLKASVLLVDDNDDVREATQQLLVACGAEVSTASNADEAWHRAAGGPVDVVLSDIRMPGDRNGIDLAHQLSNTAPPIPVVLYTGYSEQLERARALGLQVLQKPATLEQLVDALRRAMTPAR